MVDIAPIQTLDHELARESKVLAHLDGFLVQDLRREVFCNAAVVYIT